jgi:hypothetical protein
MIKIFLGLCICCASFSSCSSNSSDSVSTPIVMDSSAFPKHLFFEKNGSASLNGWTFHPSTTNDIPLFEMETPPTGGTWSLKLHKTDSPHPPNTVTETFTNLSSGIYELSVWAKMKYLIPGTNPVGSISIIKNSAGVSSSATLSTGDSIEWHLITLTDILSLARTDSVTIMLASGVSDSAAHGNALWFDDVTFRKK